MEQIVSASNSHPKVSNRNQNELSCKNRTITGNLLSQSNHTLAKRIEKELNKKSPTIKLIDK